MIVYAYETGEGKLIFRLDDLLDTLRMDIENSFNGPLDLHIDVLEMTEDAFDALPLSDESKDDLDLEYETHDTKDSRDYIGHYRGATWIRDYAGVQGYRVILFQKAGDHAWGHQHGTSAQMDKADDICRLWVTEGRMSASFVKAREELK